MNAAKSIDPMSCVSILVEPFIQHLGCAEVGCGAATAFVVEKNGQYFLVTNYHVISGRRSTSNDLIRDDGGLPTHLRCHFHAKKLGKWEKIELPLYHGDEPTASQSIWGSPTITDSTSFKHADVALLPLPLLDGVNLYPIKMDESRQVATKPCSLASVIGFPGARTSFKYFPIWVTGYIASESDLDYDNLPIVLINATTARGMSGSPVFQVVDGTYQDINGERYLDGPRMYKFLGVYSGRIPERAFAFSVEDSFSIETNQEKLVPLDIGIIWKPSVIYTLLNHLSS